MSRRIRPHAAGRRAAASLVVASTLVLAGCLADRLPPPPCPTPSAGAAATLVLIPLETPTATVDLTPVPTDAGLVPPDPCTAGDLRFAGRDLGAGLGSAASAVTVTNVTTHRCGVAGYPRIVLIGRDGRDLPTDWHPAVDGSMMFPAVREQIVELEPGDAATFAIGYSDNPSGPNENLPDEVACPPSTAVRVILAGGDTGIADVTSGPCNGRVEVSPYVRGSEPPRF